VRSVGDVCDGERSGCGGGGILEGEDFQKISPHFK
jgi:hypothetical protein